MREKWKKFGVVLVGGRKGYSRMYVQSARLF